MIDHCADCGQSASRHGEQIHPFRSTLFPTRSNIAPRQPRHSLTPRVARAVRVTARAEEREQVALNEYREAREHYVQWPHRTDGDARIALLWAYTARARWTVLADLLASEPDVPEQAVA